MAPPNDQIDSIFNVMKTNTNDNFFDLSDGKLLVGSVPLLSQVPRNITFKTFSSLCQSSDAPLPLYQRILSNSQKGGFLGFTADKPSDRLMNSIGRFTGRDFVSIFRFKTWWSTQWVGSSGSDLQMETQWLLLDVPEINAYVVIIPIIEGKFRSALHPGTDGDGNVIICAESGSTQVKASSFDAIAYVHVSDNPYNLMKEAYSAIRVHLNTFKLLEEKSVPPIVNKFGWCTWDAFYLTVEPGGVWHGVKEFADGGLSPRFLIIDDGWQSINFDGQNPQEDAKNLVLGGSQMTARLHRLDEGKKFRNYRGGSMLNPNRLPFDPEKPKKLISKAIEIEHAEKALNKAAESGISTTDLSQFESKIQKLKKELDDMFSAGEEPQLQDHQTSSSGKVCENCTCESENSGIGAFIRDLRTNFKGLDDIYVWHALSGAWGGVRPGSVTHLNSKIIPCKLSPGLNGTMDDLAVVKIVEGGIGLVHPNQADDFYDSMHSYLSKVGITGVKVDVIHVIN